MKGLKSTVAVLLAACMAISMPIEAAVNRAETSQQTTAAKLKRTKKEYAEGQAIILYEQSAVSTRSSITANSLGSDMQIEETYEFEGTGEDTSAKAAKSRSTDDSQTLKISLVKSDKYSTEELVKKLNARKDIIAAEPNYKLHIQEAGQDPYAKYQWAIDNQGQNHGTEGLDVKPKQDILETNPEGKECVIALVDTGIDYTHEDLKNVVWENPVQSNQLRGKHGYDFINIDADPMDDNGHGTHCSGIMAAEYNNAGIQGVTNNQKIKIMALKILDEDGSGYGIEFVGAYNYIYKAQQLGVNVVAVNNSWGGLEEEESIIFKKLVDLVGEKGAVTVCAAGNDGTDNDIYGGDISDVDSDYVVSVAASNENDELAAFSNYGGISVDLAAPGADILSTVSYPCFNPGIYENRNELCSLFEDFSDGNIVTADTGNEKDIVCGFAKSKGKAKMSLNLTDEAYFGLKGDGEKSLKWSISNAKEDDVYTLYFPYTAGESKTDIYDSIMIKAVEPDHEDEEPDEDDWIFFPTFSAIYVNDFELTEDGTLDSAEDLDVDLNLISAVALDKGNYWNHLSGAVSDKWEKGQKRAIAVTLSVSASGDYEVYLDNMGISKENVDEEQFGKYDYYNGTSMATPYVTGAAAALACAYPEDDARDRKERILLCTRKTAALEGKVLSEGVLDLSKVKEPNVYLKGISLDKTKNIRIEGNGLSKAAIRVNNRAVTPKEQAERFVVLNSAGLLNHYLNIEIETETKTLNESCFFSEGAGFANVGKAMGSLGDGTTISDGERIYNISPDGIVNTCMPQMKDEMGDLMYIEGIEGYQVDIFSKDEEIMPESTIQNISDIICLDGKLWTVLKLDMMYSEEKALAYYDSNSIEEKWKMACKLPKEFENLEGISIVAYQGKLYLLGGVDSITSKEQTVVMRMDPLTLKWETAASLPEARAFSKAVTIGNEMILTLGRNAAGTFPQNLIFNGRSWRVSQAKTEGLEENDFWFYYDDNMDIGGVSYYSASVGAVKDGLIYTGVQAENLGDTFFYQLSSDRYIKAGYATSNTATKNPTQEHTVVMQDKLYLLTQEEENVHVFSMPVQGVYVEVTATAASYEEEGGVLKGVQHYMAGDVISITAEPEEHYFVKQLLVDGVKIARGANGKYQYRCPVDLARKKITTSVKFGAYVSALMADEETLELYPGQSYQAEVYIIPDDAENQALVWTSSKPGTVSVNKKTGKIKVSKKAKVGSTAVITVTAADRGKIKTSLTVKVVKRQMPSKGKIVNSGKLKYQVTASSKKKKTVSCSGFSGKAVQNVKIPATVKINGFTYKVTGITKNAFAKSKKIKSVTIGKNVTSIGKNAFMNCSSLKSIQIKGKSLKKIGKNAFKGVSKGAVVSVPSKQKKSYTSKLKKAGYAGKVK